MIVCYMKYLHGVSFHKRVPNYVWRIDLTFILKNTATCLGSKSTTNLTFKDNP